MNIAEESRYMTAIQNCRGYRKTPNSSEKKETENNVIKSEIFKCSIAWIKQTVKEFILHVELLFIKVNKIHISLRKLKQENFNAKQQNKNSF